MVTAASLAVRVGYALVAGGFMGNVLGRVNGAVVDYLGFGPIVDDKWLFANFADVALLVGGILLGVVLVRSKMQARRTRAA